MNLDQIRSIADAATEADGVEPLDEGTWLSLRELSGKPEGSGDDGWRGVVTDDGLALTHGEDVHLVVRPSARGQGLGSSLLRDIDGPARAWSHGDHAAAAALARRFGFERVRDLWVMRRSMRDPLPELSQAPTRSFTNADSAELLRVNAAAFAHHPEQGAMDEANLAARMAEPWFDPAGLLVAMEEKDGGVGGRMLGFHWTKQHSPGLGEVYVVGIAPEAQGRGLGRALTLAGLHHLAGLGVSEVLLYVEGDNHAALSTYSKLGFTHADADTHVMYRREA